MKNLSSWIESGLNGFAKHCCLLSTKLRLLGNQDDDDDDDDEGGIDKHDDDDKCWVAVLCIYKKVVIKMLNNYLRQDLTMTIWDDYHQA